MNERAFKSNKHLRGARLLKWLDATPSPKTASSVCMLAHIAHLFGSPLFPKLVDFFHLRCEKLLRWKVDMHKKKTLDTACKAIIGKTPKDKLVVAFGNALWKTNLRGSRPSPRRKWVSERLRRVHGVRVLDIEEYNTSKVCNGCGVKSLKNAGSKEDTIGYLPIRVENPYHVQRCQTIDCGMWWNR